MDNNVRAQIGEKAVEEYRTEYRTTHARDLEHDLAAGDLIADILHFVAREYPANDPVRLLARGLNHYLCEVSADEDLGATSEAVQAALRTITRYFTGA